MYSTNIPKKEVVVIGGGFGGINLVKTLAKDNRYSITLIDQNNYNCFVPLLYQVATGFLEPSSICYPFRKLFQKSSVKFRMGKLIRIDQTTGTCYLDNGEINYDYLVLANGSVTNYFGNNNIATNAIPMKNMDDAVNMRNQLLQALEEASRVTDLNTRTKLLTMVVAGGGPTGVEVTGVIAELRNYIIGKDYPEFAEIKSNIYIVEGTSSLLAQMSVPSQCEAREALEALGVKVITGKFIQNFEGGKVTLSDGTEIETNNLIWASGVMVNKLEGISNDNFGSGNRIIVDAYNRIIDAQNIYAIGDASLQKTDNNFPEGHPQLAQVAIQQGVNLAKNFSAMMDGKELKPFGYKDKGTLAIVGRNKAVADLKSPTFNVGGFAALLIWLFVHLNSLISAQNKAKTLLNWIIAYLTRDHSLRMIIRPTKQYVNVKTKTDLYDALMKR